MGQKFKLPVVHLDKLWWLPNWVKRTESEFDTLLATELNKTSWIIEGNFSRTFAERLKFADFCILLDYPTELCIRSVYERSEKYRGRSRPDMTNGCLEHVDADFEQWINSFNINVKPTMLEALKNSGVDYRIFYSREQAKQWLDSAPIFYNYTIKRLGWVFLMRNTHYGVFFAFNGALCVVN